MINNFSITGIIKYINEFNRYDKPSKEFLENILVIQIYINNNKYQNEPTILYIKNKNTIENVKKYIKEKDLIGCKGKIFENRLYVEKIILLKSDKTIIIKDISGSGNNEL